MKKVLITGASSGLGLEVGTLLSGRNIEVVNISRKTSPFVDIQADLSIDSDITNAIAQITDNHSPFDTLILNAGIMPLAKIGEIDFDVDELFRVNVTGTIKLVNELLSLVKKNKADIVIVGSTAGFGGYVDHGAYCATKHALNGFIKSLQVELKKEPVRVIGFHPGGFNSNLRGGKMIDGYMEPKELAKCLISLIDLPKTMEVSEIIINRKKA